MIQLSVATVGEGKIELNQEHPILLFLLLLLKRDSLFSLIKVLACTLVRTFLLTTICASLFDTVTKSKSSLN